MKNEDSKQISSIRIAAITFALTIIISALGTTAFASGPSNDNFASAEVVSGIQVHITRSNVEATKEAGEPNHANNVGGKSVWFKWTAPKSGMFAFTTNRSSSNMDTLISIYTGSTLGNLSSLAFNDDISSPSNLRSFATYVFFQGTTYYIAVDGKSASGLPVAEGSFQLDIQPRMNYQGADYDADGVTDFSLFRPSNSTWNIFRSSNQQTSTRTWGTAGDIPIVSSLSTFQNDYAVFRPSTGILYGQTSCCLNYYANWGMSGDIPVPAQYGGGSETTFGVFRPSNGTWYIRYADNNYLFYQFGLANDIPVPGQYSADNIADIAVFRPSNGVWYFIKRVNGNPALDQYSAVQFGQSGDKPVPADYDGDGVLDVAVYRPSTGDWWVLRSSDNQAQTFHWGIAEDIPTTGDYDGDGKFDYAVFRPSTGTWYVYRSSDSAVQIKQYGQSGDIPVTANRTF